MLRHQTVALALFLSAGCEVAGPPPPARPAPPAPPAVTEPQPTEPQARPEVMLRGGPRWGKERPRFKASK